MCHVQTYNSLLYPVTAKAVEHLIMLEIDLIKNNFLRCEKCGRFLTWSHSETKRLTPKAMRKTAYFKCSNLVHDELLYFHNYEWEDPF